MDIDGLIVTAVFPGYYYAETSDRAMGIRVETPYAAPPLGWAVHLQGRCWRNADGERYIQLQDETRTSATVVEPLCMCGRSVGGGDYHFNPDWGTGGQQGVRNGAGLNNIGLLVTTSGKVGYVAREFVHIDDGSGLTDANGRAGIRVLLPAGVSSESLRHKFVVVTGASSCYRIGDDLFPQLRVADASGVKIVNQ